MVKVLSFGYMPPWAGGKVETGLANVMYQLSYHTAKINDISMTMAAIDYDGLDGFKDNLRLLGWSKKLLLKYMLTHPLQSMNSFWDVIVSKIKYGSVISVPKHFFKMLFLRYAIQKTKPNIVHLHGAGAKVYERLVPKDVDIVVTIHGNVGDDTNIKHHVQFAKLERDTFHSKRINTICFIASYLIEIFEKNYSYISPKTKVILNAYDRSQFYYEKDGTDSPLSDRKGAVQSGGTTICTVASLSDRKGQLRVLSGLTSLPNRKIFNYFCIGADPHGLKDTLNTYAKDHDIQFSYLGAMNPCDIRRHLYKADFMIMPSSSEGFGLTYLEAIACGVPVVVPKHLPIAKEPRLLTEDNTVFIEDSSVDSIVKVLPILPTLKFDREKVSLTVKDVSWDSIARQYVELYKSVCL